MAANRELEPETAGIVLDLLDGGQAAPAWTEGRSLTEALPASWTGWHVADQLGWADTYTAEYVALTQLQADAFGTLDADLARRLDGIVPTATIEALPAVARPRR